MPGPEAPDPTPSARAMERLPKFRPYLLKVANRRFGKAALRGTTASDFVQETVVVGLEALRVGKAPEEGPGALRWLKAILVNKILKHLRRPPEPPAAPRDDSTASELLARSEREERLLAALAGLTARERQVLRWKYQDGLSGNEIGRLLGCSAEHARALRRAACAKLRDALGGAESWRTTYRPLLSESARD